MLGLRFVLDPDFRKERLDVLFTWFHYRALQEHDDAWQSARQGGDLLHPVIEFQGAPGYNLALNVLNSLSVHSLGSSEPSERDFFLRHSFHQLSLSNVGNRIVGDSRFGISHPEAAASVQRALKAMPVLHPIAANSLQNLTRLVESRGDQRS